MNPNELIKMKRLFEECRDKSYELRRLREEFDGFQEKHYGFVYNERDMDDIIDMIDMGGQDGEGMTFNQFHKRMLEEGDNEG